MFLLTCTKVALRSVNLTCYCFAQVSRAGVSAYIRGANLRLGQNRRNRFLDGIGRFRDTEMLQHHSAGPDLPDGIGDAFTSDIRGRAVDRLKHRRVFILRIKICRRSDADGANNSGAEVREYVSEKIGAHDNIKPIGMTHKVSREDVDVILVRANVGVLCPEGMKAIVQKGHGMNDAVGFGGGGQMLLSFASQFESETEHAIYAAPREHRLLDGYLVFGAFIEASAYI